MKWIRVSVLSVSILYVIWALQFICKSSFIAVTGERTFSLFDDAMISMRYAWNLAHGQGLVWNPGQYVQGFTNLGMTLYMSVAAFFFDKSTAVAVVQISGICFMLLLAYVCMGIGRQILLLEEGHHRTLPVLIFVAALVFYPLEYWTLMGMENGLQAVFLYGSILAVLRNSGRGGPIWMIPILLGAAYIVRPDSAVAAACVMGYRWWGIFGKPRGHRSFLLEAALLSGIMFSVGLFQRCYFGEWIPNTYTLKVVGHPVAIRTLSGFRYVKQFWWNKTLVIPAVACLGAVVRPTRTKLLLISILTTATGYQIWVGGDAFAHFRMIAHYIPALLILFLLGIDDILEQLRVRCMSPHVHITAIILLFFFAAYGLNSDYLNELRFKKAILDVGNNKRHANLAFRLLEILEDDAEIAVFYAGTTPYYSGLRAIDLLGKCDKRIARGPAVMPNLSRPNVRYAPGHTKYDLSYSIRMLRPTYTAGLAWRSSDVRVWGRTQYVNVKYKGFDIWLLKDSESVRWSRLTSKSPVQD